MSATPVFPVHSPFVEFLGIRLTDAADGTSEVTLTLADHHLNTWDVVHGGVVMTLLDIALASAARSLAQPGTGLVTVEMKTNFMQPGVGVLRARGRVLHKSSTMAYCEGEVLDEKDRLIAKSLGTFKYLRGLAHGRRVMRQRKNPADPVQTQDTMDPATPHESLGSICSNSTVKSR
jgi:uncharacterized protein (TIGR00369 family)